MKAEGPKDSESTVIAIPPSENFEMRCEACWAGGASSLNIAGDCLPDGRQLQNIARHFSASFQFAQLLYFSQ
jgi:hypothetical protein